MNSVRVNEPCLFGGSKKIFALSAWYRHLLHKCSDLPTTKLLNKYRPSLTRSNLIGHTIFLTSEKYRMTNQEADTDRTDFPAFGVFSHVLLIASSCGTRLNFKFMIS